MQIRCTAFARVRELLGAASQIVDLPDRATIADAWVVLEARCPQLRTIAGSTQIARNGRLVRDRSEPLAADDELALLPPVGGG